MDRRARASPPPRRYLQGTRRMIGPPTPAPILLPPAGCRSRGAVEAHRRQGGPLGREPARVAPKVGPGEGLALERAQPTVDQERATVGLGLDQPGSVSHRGGARDPCFDALYPQGGVGPHHGTAALSVPSREEEAGVIPPGQWPLGGYHASGSGRGRRGGGGCAHGELHPGSGSPIVGATRTTTSTLRGTRPAGVRFIGLARPSLAWDTWYP